MFEVHIYFSVDLFITLLCTDVHLRNPLILTLGKDAVSFNMNCDLFIPVILFALFGEVQIFVFIICYTRDLPENSPIGKCVKQY